MADKAPSQGSLFRLLDAVRMRPGMYLGAAGPDFETQLERLEMLITGYGHAVDMHRVSDAGMQRYAGFAQYLERKYGWSASSGCIRTIRTESASDAEAWASFWRLLSEFRASDGGG